MHTKILVAYFIISDKKKLKYKWHIMAARSPFLTIALSPYRKLMEEKLT